MEASVSVVMQQEEFDATREPWRWSHLVAGVQAAAISFGKKMEIYEEALALLHT
jgi:hypothetical protein